MSINLLLFVWDCLLSGLLAYLFPTGRNKYWSFGVFLLLLIIIPGGNLLLLNAAQVPLGFFPFLILFGIESLFGLAWFIYSWKKRTAPASLAQLGFTRNNYWPVLAFLAFVLCVPLVSTRRDRGFTEFYIQSEDYENSPWRQVYRADQPVVLDLVVHNQEQVAINYHIYVYENALLTTQMDLGVVPPGDSTRCVFPLPMSSSELTEYEFTLTKGDSRLPYRSLFVWIQREENN